MFILDTNVVSELRKSQARIDPRVARWARSLAPETLYLSATTILELEIGFLQLERRDAKQARRLRDWMTGSVLVAFEGRVLAFGQQAALICAALHVPDPRPNRDSIIAATALVHKMTLVTRNVTDFAGTGVDLLNPWQAGGTTV